MNSQKTTITILITLSATALALAEDFKTVSGKEYKDATVTRVEPDGIILKTKSGLFKVYFTELSNGVQKRFNYDPQQAAAFSAAEAASYAATQNQQQKQLDGAQRQQATTNQSLAKVGQVQATVNDIAALEGRYAQIKSEEAILEERIHEMQKWHLTRLERADLAALRKQLAALKSEEREIKAELEKVKRASP